MQTHPRALGLCRVARGKLPAWVWGRADRHSACGRHTERHGQTQPSPPLAKPFLGCQSLLTRSSVAPAQGGGALVRASCHQLQQEGPLGPSHDVSSACFPPLALIAASHPPSAPWLARACLGEGHAPGRLPGITDCVQCWRG